MDRRAKGAYTLIGEGTIIEGDLSVPHPVRIDGTLKGRLRTSEMLTVGTLGVIEADVIAKSAMIGGRIVGNVQCEDRVELEAKATLIGDLVARDVVINEGAVFQGNCTMQSSAAPRK